LPHWHLYATKSILRGMTAYTHNLIPNPFQPIARIPEVGKIDTPHTTSKEEIIEILKRTKFEFKIHNPVTKKELYQINLKANNLRHNIFVEVLNAVKHGTSEDNTFGLRVMQEIGHLVLNLASGKITQLGYKHIEAIYLEIGARLSITQFTEGDNTFTANQLKEDIIEYILLELSDFEDYTPLYPAKLKYDNLPDRSEVLRLSRTIDPKLKENSVWNLLLNLKFKHSIVDLVSRKNAHLELYEAITLLVVEYQKTKRITSQHIGYILDFFEDNHNLAVLANYWNDTTVKYENNQASLSPLTTTQKLKLRSELNYLIVALSDFTPQEIEHEETTTPQLDTYYHSQPNHHPVEYSETPKTLTGRLKKSASKALSVFKSWFNIPKIHTTTISSKSLNPYEVFELTPPLVELDSKTIRKLELDEVNTKQILATEKEKTEDQPELVIKTEVDYSKEESNTDILLKNNLEVSKNKLCDLIQFLSMQHSMLPKIRQKLLSIAVECNTIEELQLFEEKNHWLKLFKGYEKTRICEHFIYYADLLYLHLVQL
jgi:hypothetical protein